ncbi:hypothetical protein FQA39_LY16436 [Lamprigera yunnana]|nr:hypothetical protein FQA39_LY16436 [Lamprigera yunnana]
MCNVPKKNATLDDSNAVKCSKCGLLYHPSCAKRAKINADGWVNFCCYSTAADEVNEVNDLDENSRVLFKLIEAKFNGLEVKFNGLDSKIDNTLITVKEKLCELDDRVLKLEDNNVYLLENVISEINKRNMLLLFAIEIEIDYYIVNLVDKLYNASEMCNVPKKNATLDDSNAVKCSKCGLLYHPSCAKRAKINADGWVNFCCYSTAADEVNEVNDLDENSRVLFKLIEAKFNGLEVKFNGLDSKIDNTLITVKEKLCELDDRVLKLEDNNVYLLENVISEINKRNSKECNCIIYKLEDSENAVKKDIELFKNLLACCNDEPSFNINDIKLIRLGKKFKSGVDRPLKVVFPNKDCLHWFFHNKKMIIEKSKKSIIITGDLTNAQRDFRNKVLSEIKLRREKGEDNLFMKYINGIPTIVSKDESFKSINLCL